MGLLVSRRAPGAAWTNARVLWRIWSEPGLRDDYLGVLDGFVARVGRGLLRPLV